ncbi:hypothetical protein H4S14_003627 [Agrobacterium vitis]|nr:hypothetical protein [Agrobacterium vitis]MBE1439859.1 hypothetical protein [Agrobacterium vitis]
MILSRELDAIANDLSSGRHIAEAELVEIGQFLGLLAKLAKNQESELAVHRLAEAGKAGRVVVDQLATKQFTRLAEGADAKIVRPDFGGKR